MITNINYNKYIMLQFMGKYSKGGLNIPSLLWYCMCPVEFCPSIIVLHYNYNAALLIRLTISLILHYRTEKLSVIVHA